MKVSDNTAESAILGYSKIESMGVANTPEFIQVLSTSLYKYQKLAFVRETIANAWDAHIESNQLEKPIKIQITNGVFSIQDFGSGIAVEDMARVYGTYGLGTKANDSKSTGGFGLGCKSPFAYVDSFEVISCHAGTKTIYQIAKTGGIPSIVTLGSMPTEETGLTVNITVKPNHVSELKELARNIVYGGDILSTINDIPVETIGLERKTGSICFILDLQKKVELPHLYEHRLLIRYANMLYPLPSRDTENKEWTNTVNQLLEYIEPSYKKQFIIQAEDNSLSVQPSREGLSETESTMENLTQLLQQVITRFDKEYTENSKSYIQDIKNSAVQEMRKTLGSTPRSTEFELSSAWGNSVKQRWLSSYYRQSDLYLIINTYDQWVRYKTLIRLELTIQEIYELELEGAATPQDSGLDQGMCQLYYKHKLHRTSATSFFYKLYRKLLRTGPNIPEHKLFLPTHQKPVSINDYALKNNRYLSAQRQVVLTCKQDLKLEGEEYNSVIYYVQRTKNNIENARKFLASTGYTIIDKTKERTKPSPQKRQESKTSVKGLVHPKGLVDFYEITNQTITFDRAKSLIDNQNTVILDQPKHIIYMPREGKFLKGKLPLTLKMFKILEGHLQGKVAVAFSKSERDKWNKHVMPLGNIILESLRAAWESIKDSYTHLKINTLSSLTSVDRFIFDIYNTPELRDLLPFTVSSGPTDQQKLVVNAIHEMYGYWMSYIHTLKYHCKADFTQDMLLKLKILDKETRTPKTFTPELSKFREQTSLFFKHVCLMELELKSGCTDKMRPIYEAIITQIRSMEDE